MKTRGDSQLSSLNQRITMVSFTKTCSERIGEEREREGMGKENNDDGRAFGIRKSEFEFEISI